MDAPPPDDDLRFEPVDDAGASDPVVTDVTGRLWRVRKRPPGRAADLVLAVGVLVLLLALGVALIR